MAAIDEVLSILAESKTVLELPTATSAAATDWAIIWNNDSNKLEKILVSNLTKTGNWLFIEGSWVEKDSGNFNISALEINDLVWFKDVLLGTVTITLLGWRYDGGDKTQKASYTKIKSIA